MDSQTKWRAFSVLLDFLRFLLRRKKKGDAKDSEPPPTTQRGDL